MRLIILHLQSLLRDTAGGNHVLWNRREGTEEDGCHTVSSEGICCLENYDLGWDHRPVVNGQPTGSSVEPAPGDGLKLCLEAGNCIDKGSAWSWQPVTSVEVYQQHFIVMDRILNYCDTACWKRSWDIWLCLHERVLPFCRAIQRSDSRSRVLFCICFCGDTS